MTPAFRYRRKNKLELTDETLAQISALAQIMCTQKEAAAVIGCSLARLEQFFGQHPEAREAWYDGKRQGRASLRRLLWKQAQDDPGQARFLAKDKRWLQMEDKSVEVNINVKQISDEERRSRVLELQAKVINHADAITDLEPVEPRTTR